MNPRRILEDLGISPSKSKGQNFLFDRSKANSIVSFSEINEPNPTILEVGPGLGVLSEFISKLTTDYFLVELEKKFVSYLQSQYVEIPIDNFINLDFRKVNLSEVFKESKGYVISNVPYSFSTDMILWLVKFRESVNSATLLFQKEFAERIGAKNNTKAYGSISVLSQYYFDCKLGPSVSGDSFFPKARVESRVLRLQKREKKEIIAKDEKLFERFTRSSFAKRRKTILNSLSSSDLFESKDEIREFLIKSGIDSNLRAETLSVNQFVELSNLYVDVYS